MWRSDGRYQWNIWWGWIPRWDLEDELRNSLVCLLGRRGGGKSLAIGEQSLDETLNYGYPSCFECKAPNAALKRSVAVVVTFEVKAKHPAWHRFRHRHSSMSNTGSVRMYRYFLSTRITHVCYSIVNPNSIHKVGNSDHVRQSSLTKKYSTTNRSILEHHRFSYLDQGGPT